MKQFIFYTTQWEFEQGSMGINYWYKEGYRIIDIFELPRCFEANMLVIYETESQ